MEAPRELQRLVRLPNVVAVNVWSVSDGNSCQINFSSIKPDEELVAKSSRLVAEAAHTGQVQTRILSSRYQQFLVAAPVPNSSLDCEQKRVVTGLFSHGSDDDHRSAFEIQRLEVEVAAAKVALASKAQATVASDSTEAAPVLLRHAVWTAAKQSVARCRSKAKAYALTLMAVAAIGSIPLPHRIKAPVVCEPATRRFVSAPFDARLLKAHVAPGDSVVKDQILAELDGSDLRSQLASLHAQRAQAVQRRSAALSTGDASKAELQRLEGQQLSSEIALLEDRQRNLAIRSPITGVIVSGDMERAEGIPLGVGDSLFEIAPLQDMIAEVAIPESNISFVNVDMQADLSFDGTPNANSIVTLHRIHPRSEIRDNANVFVGEAQIDNTNLELRPGMNGTARIEVGYAPVAWQLFRRPYNALRELIGW